MKRTCHFLIDILLLFLLASGGGGEEERDAPASPGVAFSDRTAIRRELTDLLQDPLFIPQKTWQQWLDDRLRVSPKGRGFRRLPSRPGWSIGFSQFLLGACLLLGVLVAYVLVNLGFGTAAFRRKHRKPAPMEMTEESLFALPYDDLAARLQSLERANRFPDALAMMRLALLKYLHSRQVLRFHPSKTNGEYGRECAESYSGIRDLRDYLTHYDRLLYAGQSWGETAYRRMKSLYAGMTSHEG